MIEISVFFPKGHKEIPMTSENETFDWLSKSRCSGFLVIHVFLTI